MEIPGMITIDRTMAGELWQAFTTLSDAQELISLGDSSRANEEINHAKRHFSEVFNTLTDDEKRKAMMDTWTCTLNLEGAKSNV